MTPAILGMAALAIGMLAITFLIDGAERVVDAQPHERQMSAVGCYIFFSMALLAALALGFLMLVGKGIL
jgi:hypothetical protein